MSLHDPFSDLRRQGRLAIRYLRYEDFPWAKNRARKRGEALATLFRTVNTWLRQSGVDHWICYGTALGWWRERGILSHDRDVDFAAPVEAYAILQAAAGRLPRGFTLHDTSHKHDGPKLYISHDGWEADIYFLVPEKNTLRPILNSPNPGDTAPFPRAWFYPAQTADFLGEPASVPPQAELYLKHTYGYIGPDAELDPVTRYYRPRQR